MHRLCGQLGLVLLMLSLSACSLDPAGVDIWSAVANEDLPVIRAYVQQGGDLNVGASTRRRTPLIHALELDKRLSKKRSFQVL